jgi:nucleoside-diphosphate-sugar epimerase
MTLSVFFTGATGYIGGPILYQLLQKKGEYQITALIRAKDKASKLEALGVRVVLGALDDTAIIAEESFKADIVIHTADCDHLPSAKAIVEGLQKKYKETVKKGIYLHTSGSGIVSVNSRGNLDETIWNDDDVAQMESIPATNPHRDVDLHIFANKSAFDLAIIAPTTIYGRGHYIEGISNPISIQIPVAIKGALKHKKAQGIGKGLNRWSNVHVDDVADLFIILLNKLLKGELKGDDQGYYFAENGEHAWGEIYQEIGNVLHKKGIAQDASVREANTDEEIKDAFGFVEAVYYIASNSRARAKRGRKFGWNPKFGPDAVIKSIEPDIDYLLAQQAEKK